MAIRFDKDTRRATNGPMIFFSDPSAEISLGEEIRGAIGARLSFYAYRCPGDMMISFGSSEGVVEGIGTPGFAVAPFLPSLPYLTIPYRPQKAKEYSVSLISDFPVFSTTREEHAHEISEIQKALAENDGGKIVAVRVIIGQGRVDLGATFSSLCKSYPDAFVFCFSTPHTGCWIGASPELLLESRAGSLHTMALAGTRKMGADGGWDEKNIEEQRMVTDFIIKAFSKTSIEALPEKTFSKRAGAMEHICTPITARPQPMLNEAALNGLLRELSPTPALCGMPRPLALKIIKETEHFNRGCYGGFCGPYHSPADFSFHVNLRSACVEDIRYCLYCGGGITRKSNPGSEWDETELKSQTIRRNLVFI